MRHKFLIALLAFTLCAPVAFGVAPTAKKPAAKPAVVSVKPKAPEAVLKDFTFKGNRIGEPATEVINRVFGQKQPDETLYGQKQQNINDAQQACLKAIKAEGESSCTDFHPHITDRPKEFIIYEFYDSKFSGFKLYFPNPAFVEVQGMLMGKYGTPHKWVQSNVQNRMGATFEREEHIWNTLYGPMTLYYHYPDLETGMLILTDKNIDAIKASQNMKKLEEKGKATF